MKKAFPEIKEEVLQSLTDDQSKKIFASAQKLTEPFSKKICVIENGMEQTFAVTRNGAGPIITQYGKFWLYNFSVSDEWKKYSAIIKCDKIDPNGFNPIIRTKNNFMVRIDSGCETGQLFGDATCECKEQLHKTMQELQNEREGLIVHIPNQDGRGKGMPFKLATLYLQEQLGLNTVQSAACLAGSDAIDVRTYSGAVSVMMFLGITPAATSLNVATNNPDKLNIFRENGYYICSSPVKIEGTDYTRQHLQAKKEFLKHQL